MKIPEHIAIITDQIEAMRKERHAAKSLVSIQLDAIEYAKDTILADFHKSAKAKGNDAPQAE